MFQLTWITRRANYLPGIILSWMVFIAFPVPLKQMSTKNPRSPILGSHMLRRSANFAALFVASDAGLFAKYGLNAHVQMIPAPTAAKGLLAGETDFFVDGPFLVPSRLNGAPVKYIGAHMFAVYLPDLGFKGYHGHSAA